MSASTKGNGKTQERRAGLDRRVGAGSAYTGSDRRTKKPRRKSDRAPDKPVRR